MRRVFERFEFPGLFGRTAACGLEFRGLPDGRIVVIATELSDNPGVSVTNFADGLAVIVCTAFDFDPAKLVWIEHYPAYPCRVCGGFGKAKDGQRPCPACRGRGLRREKPTYDLVTFKLDRFSDGFGLSQPKWRPMSELDWSELGVDPASLFFRS